MNKHLASVVCALVVSCAVLISGSPLTAQEAPESSSSPAALRVYEGARNAQVNNAFDVAAEEWKKFLDEFPNDPLVPRVLYNLGVCHVQLRQWEPAIKAFNRVVNEFPKSEDLEKAYLNLGWSQYSLAQGGNQNAYADASKTFAALLEKFPDGERRDEALFFLGESHYLQGNKQDATIAYRQLVDEFPMSKLREEALYALGVAHEELENYDEAGSAYDEFLDGYPEHQLVAEVTMRKAETLLQTGAVEQAEQLFGEAAAIENFAAADHARLRQAYCASRLEKHQEAADLYAAIVSDFPDSPYVAEAELAAARDYYRAKSYDEAKKWFTAVRQRGGESAIEAAHWLCRILLSQKQPAEAERLATQILPEAHGSPYYVELLLDQADAIYEQGNRQPAFDVYLKVANEHGDHRLAPQALYNAAFTAFELQQFDESVNLARQFIEKFSSDPLAPDAKYLAAECLIQKRDYAAAETELQELVSEHQRADSDAWKLRLGLVMYLSGDHAAAISYLEPLVAQLQQPDRIAEAHFLIGVCRFLQNDYTAAAKQLEASLAASNTWRQAGEATVYLARCRQREGRLDDAIALLEQVLEKSTSDAAADQAQYRLGEVYYAAGNFAAARDAYAATVANHASSTYVPFALYGKGWSQIKLREYPAAVDSFNALLENHGQHELADDGQLALAMARRQAGELDAAIRDFDAFLKTNPPQPQKSDALYERGLAEAALQQTEKAIATFTSLLDENPNYASADKVRYELAWAYRDAQQNDKALAEFARLVAENSQSPLAAEASFHLGEDHYQKQQYEQAIEAYSAAKEQAQDGELKEKALYKLGWSHFQSQQFEPALKHFEEQASNYPDGPLYGDAVFMQGECLFKLEKYEPALKMFNAAQQSPIQPSSPQMGMLALLHGGQSAAQLEQWDDALQQLNSLIDEHPDSPYKAEALYERGYVLQKQGKLDQAWNDFEVAADQRSTLGARARFMMGELRFAQKKYDEAIREFQRGMYLYGGDEAPAEIKTWQAKSAFEAGRCAELMIESAPSPQRRAEAIAEAKKFYSFVAQKHSDDPLAPDAQKRLEALSKL